MKSRIGAALVAALVMAPAAHAAPAVVDVRVEGASRTLFEGPVRTDGRDIQAASDSQSRPCDGTSLGANPTPGPTATGATVDALAITGRDFDGLWYAGYEDYFLQRWGPDREDPNTGAYWGITVNDRFTPVGGCQFRVRDGDRVLWVYDAFSARPFLKLTGAGAAAVDEEVTVTVRRLSGAMDGAPHDEAPAAGVTVAPVSTDAAGDQTVLEADPAARTTDADGRATVRFSTPGWHRIKAIGAGYVRSNRLDLCVGVCGPPPADTLVRELAPPPPPTPTPSPTPTVTPDATATPAPTLGPPLGPLPPPPPPPPAGPTVRIDAPRVVTNARRGRIAVRWRVLDAGAGVRGWTIESTLAGRSTWTRRATGANAQSAALRLPAGRSHDLRFTLTDALERATTVALGRVVVPRDDRAVLRRGWARVSDRGAWRGTVSRGERGATARVRLAAGRPLVLVRGARRGTQVRVGTKTYRLTPRTRTITAARRSRAGRVTVRVLAGRVEVDGFAVAP